MADEKIETFDKEKGVGIASGKAPTGFQGPFRKAPAFYAGEFYGTKKVISALTKRTVRVPREINYPDMERHANGAHPGKRDKLMRRVIRGALKRRFSKFERGLKLPRAMLGQAIEVMRDEGRKGNRAARRLFAKELAIHRPQPSEPTRAQRRAYQKLLKKQGRKDAIAQLVDAMAKP